MDLTTAQSHLDAWLAADLAVAEGRSVQLDGRALTREDAATIRSQIEYWQRTVNNLAAASQGARLGLRIARWT